MEAISFSPRRAAKAFDPESRLGGNEDPMATPFRMPPYFDPLWSYAHNIVKQNLITSLE
jgi:hypothetical protein